MLQDALLAYLHFGLILALSGMLFSEVMLYRQEMERSAFALLARIDAWYGAIAGLVAASGVSRVLWGVKGYAYYLHNPVFWTKISLFLTVALLSIPPTIHYIRLRNTQPGTGPVKVEAGTYRMTRVLLTAQVVILLIIPLLAVLMARGI